MDANIDINTPIWQLTVGQFKELLAEVKPEIPQQQEPKYVHGLDGLAELLGCSKRTAQNIKASGKIDKAIYQEGRTIIIDRKLAIELLK